MNVKLILSKNLPRNRPLNELEIKKFGKKFIPYFRGVFCRDQFKNFKKRKIEAAVVNLNLLSEPGSHWVAYYYINNFALYFDSYGNLMPPVELIKYFGKYCKVYYYYKQIQKFGETNCGQLSQRFLLETAKKLFKT